MPKPPVPSSEEARYQKYTVLTIAQGQTPLDKQAWMRKFCEHQKGQQVQCAACYRGQPDRGVKKTCPYCGVSPVPSYSYPPGSGFHPLD